MTETKERKKRVRRNYERELRQLQLYCEIKIDVLDSLEPGQTTNLTANAAQMQAYQDILKRLNGGPK